MTANDLFDATLHLQGAGWRVTATKFQGEPPQLELTLEQGRDGQVLCPECGQRCGAYDTVEKRWPHLNFFQYRCELVARVPRANCATPGVRLTRVPWAGSGSGFTLLFERGAVREREIGGGFAAAGEQEFRPSFSLGRAARRKEPRPAPCIFCRKRLAVSLGRDMLGTPFLLKQASRVARPGERPEPVV